MTITHQLNTLVCHCNANIILRSLKFIRYIRSPTAIAENINAREAISLRLISVNWSITATVLIDYPLTWNTWYFWSSSFPLRFHWYTRRDGRTIEIARASTKLSSCYFDRGKIIAFPFLTLRLTGEKKRISG